MKGSEGKCNEVQCRKGVKAGCNVKDICGWVKWWESDWGKNVCAIWWERVLESIYSIFFVFLMRIFVNCICLACIVVIFFVFIYLICICFTLYVFVVPYVYLLYYVCIAVLILDASSQYPEGPATGHLDTGFSLFPSVYKRTLRWFATLQVATTCFSYSPSNLNFLVTFFHICVHVK